MRASLLLPLACLAAFARAEWWDDFSNNLTSDLAPIIALFGEQVTKQFLSESTSKLDNFIFAMMPLGILTAVVSAIRVCGGPSLRAFIGRAQEGGGVAEAELCSSTSRDVCELYHNGSIVRVFGRPKILEVLHDNTDANFDDDPKDDGGTANCGLYLFEDYIQSPPEARGWTENGEPSTGKPSGAGAKPTTERDAEAADGGRKGSSGSEFERGKMNFAPNPNLSLNIGIKKHPRAMWAAALIGLTLQSSIIVFASLVSFYWRWEKNGHPTPTWAFVLMASGTVLQCSGMYCCAMLVERSTDERMFRRKGTQGQDEPRLYIVQPGNQVVGDQTFDAFSFSTDPKHPFEEYTTSWKDPERQIALWKVYGSVGATLFGFVSQFIGLRFMHSIVAVAQLSAIVFMSLVRSMLRTQRLGTEKNRLRDRLDEVEGFELDWLAIHIGRGGNGDPKHEIPQPVVVGPTAEASNVDSKTDINEAKRTESIKAAAGSTGMGSTINPKNRDVAAKTGTVPSAESTEGTKNVEVVDNGDGSVDHICVISPPSPIAGAISSTTEYDIKVKYRGRSEPYRCEEGSEREICPVKIFQYRTRLAQLTNQSKPGSTARSNAWGEQVVRARPQARQLKKAIEASADILFSYATINENYKKIQQFTWSLGSQYRAKVEVGTLDKPYTSLEQPSHPDHPSESSQPTQRTKCCEIHLSVNRTLLKDNKLSPWQADQNALEAVVGLSTWRIVSDPSTEDTDGFRLSFLEAAAVSTGRILAVADSEEGLKGAEVELKLWTDDFPMLTFERRAAPNLPSHLRTPNTVWKDDAVAVSNRHSVPRVRFFGWDTINRLTEYDTLKGTGLLTTFSSSSNRSNDNNDLTTLCAQDVYQSFICSVTAAIDSFGPLETSQPGMGGFVLRNDVISKLIDCFEENGLGSRHDAFLVVVSALRSRNKLPSPLEALPAILTKAEDHRKAKQYEQAENLLKWSFYHLQNFEADQVVRPESAGLDTVMLSLGELYRSLLYGEKHLFASNGMFWIRKVLPEDRLKGTYQRTREVVKRYIEVHERGERKNTPSAQDIMEAISNNRRAEALWLFSQKRVEILTPDENGRTVLSFAAEKGWMEVVKAALELGSSINAVDSNIRTPISYASERGHAMVVEFLTSQQVSLNLADNRGQTPLLYAASAGFVTTVEVLMKDQRIDIYSCDQDGRSVLFQACQNGHVDVVRLLLKTGAREFINVEVPTHGWTLTPLAAAIEKDEPELVPLLVENGANMNIEVRHRNLLTFAVSSESWKCAEHLLELSHKQREIGLELPLPKDTIVVLLMPRRSSMPLHSNHSAGRGGIVLSQLDRDGKEVSMTVEAAHLIYDDDYWVISYLVNAAGKVEPLESSAHTADGVLALLIGEFGDKFCVDEEMLIKAVSNRWNMPWSVQNLLDAGGKELQITGRVVDAALRFHAGDIQNDLVARLLRRCDNALPIQMDVLEAISWNFELGTTSDIVLRFFKLCQDRFEIPVSYIKAVVGRYALNRERSEIEPFLAWIHEYSVDAALSTMKIAEVGNHRYRFPSSLREVCTEELDWINELRRAIQMKNDAEGVRLIGEGSKKYGPSGKDYVPILLVLALRREKKSPAGVVQSLLEWPGLDVNAPVLTGRRSMLFAASHLADVRSLVKAGANPKFADFRGDTPIWGRDIKILKELIGGESRDENMREMVPEQALRAIGLDDVDQDERESEEEESFASRILVH